MPSTLYAIGDSPRAHRANNHGRKRALIDTAPPWAKWKGSRAGRAIRFIEGCLRFPTGIDYGKSFKLAPFQCHIIEELLAEDCRTGGLQICRGNAKSTLTAAIGLWALVTEEDAPQVPLVAFNARHADRTLFTPIRNMLGYSPMVADYCVLYNNMNDKRLYSQWNNGELYPLPANEDALQGLNPTVAIIDEAQTVPDHILWAVRQGAGKRPDSVTLAIGTPGPEQASALYRMRELAAAEAGVKWVEYSAPPDCDVNDRAAWALANPALEAGFLDIRVIEDEAKAIALDHPGARAMFRMYRLGHWVEGSSGWLPPGSFDDCPYSEPLDEGAEVVLAVDGTYRRSTAVMLAKVGSGELHFGWAAEQASDEQLADVLEEAFSKYQVVELVHFPKVRRELIKKLEDAHICDVMPWKGLTIEEISSANEMHRAVVERRLAHDHNPLLIEQMGNVHARVTEDGLRLSRPLDDGKWIDVANAARMAWWRALARESDTPQMFTVG